MGNMFWDQTERYSLPYTKSERNELPLWTPGCNELIWINSKIDKLEKFAEISEKNKRNI